MRYVWNLTTREEYVVKRPLRKLIKSGKVDLKSWSIEAGILQTISHVSTGVPRFLIFAPTLTARDLRNILLRSEM